MTETFEKRHLHLHGHDLGYRTAGSGPVVLLVHGMAGRSDTWLPVMNALSEHCTVVAPDLLGHGDSDKPRTDYSLGAFASGLRDLMVALGHERATVVGHSLGGGVVMQFAYQFPERCERIVLESSGGLGDEVNVLLRALTLPGAEYVLPAACHDRVHAAGVAMSGWLAKIGLRVSPHLEQMWTSYGSLADGETRTAFLHTLRSVVDHGGQRVSAADRLYLTAGVPTLIMWGERDRIIPVEQGRAAHEAISDSRLEIFEGAGHFPHSVDPARFSSVLLDFLATTSPSTGDASRWRDQLLASVH